MSEISVDISVINPKEYAERGCRIPRYQSAGASGLDLYACIPNAVKLGWCERLLITTGIKVSIPYGYEGQIRSRNGAAMNGIVVANAPGTIDSDYRGEIRVLITNINRREFQDEPDGIWIRPGHRLAQLVICPVTRANLRVTNQLDTTARGDSTPGSTGGLDLPS